ncbi:MAG: hypothetical protein ACRBM6_33670 [Geminicoccales bacterium]
MTDALHVPFLHVSVFQSLTVLSQLADASVLPVGEKATCCISPNRLSKFRHVISGSLALASLDHTWQDLVPPFSATLTTIAFNNSSLPWFEAST